MQNPATVDLRASGRFSFAAIFPDRTERRCLTLIGLVLLAWFALSRIAVAVYGGARSETFEHSTTLVDYAMKNATVFIAVFGSMAMIRLAKASGDETLFACIARRIRERPQDLIPVPVRLLAGVASFTLFLVAFATIKTLIPTIAPFSWDEAFLHMDRALFFGRDPWTLFEGFYRYPLFLRSLDFAYDAWTGVLVGSWLFAFVISSQPAARRYRYCIALLLTYFAGGTVLAILLSSAGPVYFAAVTGLPDAYAAQMAYLNIADAETPLGAVQYQRVLWAIYETPGTGIGGISAMPSMHCATCFLLVLWAWNHGVWRIVALGYFILIYVSSFLLAWHYAVDGILAVLVAGLCWMLAGRITGRFRA